MLRAECYKQRMEKGLSFLEFNYMIMQAYDFMYLHDHYGVNMQFGGDDQWSNMLAGTELIRRKTGDDCFAMTQTLLMNKEGKKMGKTAKGAVWLDPAKTTPYEFYQYWRNIDDADVMMCFRLLTFRSLEEIADIAKWDDSRINEKKELLAHDLTELVHGREEADKAQSAAREIFAGNLSAENMPTETLSDEDFKDGVTDILQLLVAAKLCPTRSDARRLVQQGGVTVDDVKVTDFRQSYTRDDLKDGLVLKKGKKAFRRIVL